MATVSIRAGSADDLPAIAAIYTHYVLRTTITFNTQVRTPKQWVEIHDRDVASGRYHLLVAELDGQVAGYAQTGRFRDKPAYDRSLEVSVYVAPDAVGAGVGGALYGELLRTLEDDERYHRAYALIALPNDASAAFHERWGFVHRGTLTEAGYKFGRYLDVAYYERAL